MDLARYEIHRSAEFQFSTFRLRPQASFTMNLREACDTETLLQGPAPDTQIIVCGETTLVPMAAFQEEEVEDIYNFCFPSEQPRRIFFDTLPFCSSRWTSCGVRNWRKPSPRPVSFPRRPL